MFENVKKYCAMSGIRTQDGAVPLLTNSKNDSEIYESRKLKWCVLVAKKRDIRIHLRILKMKVEVFFI